MKKLMLLLFSATVNLCCFAQNTLQVIDTGNITRERWRDSVLRMDMQQVPTGFLREYAMFDFEMKAQKSLFN